MDSGKKRDKIVLQIWELRAKVHLYRFMFGALSSQEKVNEFNEYFTGRILFYFQNSLETQILVDLRNILDRSKQDVISIFKIADRDKLKKLNEVYKDVSKYINNVVTHKNVNDYYSFKFKDVICTIEELQKILDNDESGVTVYWEAEKMIHDEFEEFYEKVKRVNELERQNKKSKPVTT